MNNIINVLVFPAGEVNSIELHDALSTCVNINVIGASSIDRHGEFVFRNYISGLPMLDDSKFLPAFNKILNENSVDVVFPAHDTIADFFAHQLEKIDAKVVVAEKNTARICRDKRETYRTFRDFKFCPQVYESCESIDAFPVFVKPRIGQGSIGVTLCKTVSDIQLINFENNVVTEFLPGKELTVDCITDVDGVLKNVSPRSRDRIFAGISVAGTTEVLSEEVKSIADTINSQLKFIGLWFFQLKKGVNGKYKLLEISTRCAGTMCLTRALGVNLPLLSVYTLLGYPIEVQSNTYVVQVDRTLISRYRVDFEYDTVYFDFDDTLIVRNEVNLNAIRFLFQCSNQGKKIILITRHADNLQNTFSLFNIHQNIFTEIFHLKDNENKSDYIKPGKAIFVDNAYSERKEVSNVVGIPVFDVDGIEVLLDWRS